MTKVTQEHIAQNVFEFSSQKNLYLKVEKYLLKKSQWDSSSHKRPYVKFLTPPGPVLLSASISGDGIEISISGTIQPTPPDELLWDWTLLMKSFRASGSDPKGQK